MPRRQDARRVALQMLYLLDINPDTSWEQIARQVETDLTDADLSEFALTIIRGVREQQEDVDERIAAVARNWRLQRMAPTDRNVIRLAAFEMRQMGTPPAVAINEAVNLAREFGSENSAAFVNGILDQLHPESVSGRAGDQPPE